MVVLCYSWIGRYVNRDRDITRRIVQHAEARGIKGLFITVDAPQLGHREKVLSSALLVSNITELPCHLNIYSHFAGYAHEVRGRRPFGDQQGWAGSRSLQGRSKSYQCTYHMAINVFYPFN